MGKGLLDAAHLRADGIVEARLSGGTPFDRPIDLIDAVVECIAHFDQRAQRPWQLAVALDVGGTPGLAQLDTVALGPRFLGRDLALLQRAPDHEPGGELEQPGGETHALGRVEHGYWSAQGASFLASLAVEVAGRALHEPHARL